MNYEYTLYFIQETSSKNIKIGITKRNISERLKELEIGNSDDLKIIYKIDEVPFSFETYLHQICEVYNVKGEWYSPKAIDHLLKHPFYKENLIKVKN